MEGETSRWEVVGAKLLVNWIYPHDNDQPNEPNPSPGIRLWNASTALEWSHRLQPSRRSSLQSVQRSVWSSWSCTQSESCLSIHSNRPTVRTCSRSYSTRLPVHPNRCLKKELQAIRHWLIRVTKMILFLIEDRLTAERRWEVAYELFRVLFWYRWRIELIGVVLVVKPEHWIAFLVLIEMVGFLDSLKSSSLK